MATANETVKKVLEDLRKNGGGKSKVIETGTSNNIFYRVWSDGLIEQWLIVSEQNTNKSYTFPKPYSSENYCLVGVGFWIDTVAQQQIHKSTTGFSTSSVRQSSATYAWYACGY